eukprot:6196516-Pleurochrysis_carterae.AAC.2
MEDSAAVRRRQFLTPRSDKPDRPMCDKENKLDASTASMMVKAQGQATRMRSAKLQALKRSREFLSAD